MFAPVIDSPETSRDMVSIFAGYNHNLRISDGLSSSTMEWYDEENLSTDQFPVMSPCTTPTTVTEETIGLGVTSFTTTDGVEHHAYAYHDSFENPRLFIDNRSICPLSEDDSVRNFVIMGANLLVFPDHIYVNVNTLNEQNVTWGHMDATVDLNSPKLSPCDKDGTVYTNYTTSATAPSSPSDGDVWLDTSTEPHVYKKWYASSSMWLPYDVYVRVEELSPSPAPWTFGEFSEGDGIILSVSPSPGQGGTQAMELNGSHIIQKVSNHYIVIIGLLDVAVEPGTVSVSRNIPDMDYVIECNNRLWGCKFGLVPGRGDINELYCCKLGDFKNWEVYEGLSTDSWRASVGTEGAWTGAVAYNGYPTFFKENSIHKIYISSTGAHQVVVSSADGIGRGSWRSTAIINGVLFYLSAFGVMAYTGTRPAKVSEQIPYALYDGVAGSLDKFYYLSAEDSFSAPLTFVYDTELQVWHKLSPHRATMYTPLRKRLAFEQKPIGDSTYCTIKEIESRGRGMEEVYGDWYATSGVIGFAYPDNKYLSRFVFRMDLAKGSWCELFIEYDSDTKWLSKGRMYRPGLQTFVLPVMPRRCDHCRIKLIGSGDFKLYSISKILEVGSDY